ncbi:alpha/beta hydrolase family protein [Granulicoccus sp. GXG6511]|uniref:alpha/beta hydrolase family protein n=1 Tax=Granulicoccus sp. GXG6511 TaxID=3381351 RepID=UPI003D7DF8DA
MADLINHPLIAERYFFPGGRAPTSRLDVNVDDAVLACGVHRVDPDGFTVVFFHGNGEVVADWQGTLDKILGMLGWDLLLAEYRGYGGSTGQPLLGAMLDDVGAIIDAAGPPEKVVVMGRSVGSFFALEAVSRFPKIAGLILESAIADPLERLLLRVSPEELGGSPEEIEAMQSRVDHQAKIGGYRGPTLILHTRVDGLVDVSHAQRLKQWAGGDARLRIFDNGNHNSILWENTNAYIDEIAALLARSRPRG